MTTAEAYVAFNLTENIGSVKVAELIKEYGDIVSAWEAYPQKQARSGDDIDYRREFKKAKEFGVTILTPDNNDYPKMLLEYPSHPLALYVKGDVKALSKPAIAMVGTRRATSYGIAMAEQFASELSMSGWMILSGLALGIDAASHRGALAVGGITVGVLGSALDVFYPEENRELAREIVQKGGAVVSEFPFGRPPDTQTFPQRNHIVAALSCGVLVVECPLKSGTLITAGIAAELGKTVMAIPSRIDSRPGRGANKLIRDGARLVCSSADVLEELSELIPKSKPTVEEVPEVVKKRVQKRVEMRPIVTLEESMILKHVDEDGVSMEKLIDLTGFSAAKTSALCMALRIKGRLKYLPGNRVATTCL